MLSREPLRVEENLCISIGVRGPKIFPFESKSVDYDYS